MYQDYKNVEMVKPAGLDLKDRLVGVQRVTKVTKEVVHLDFLLSLLWETKMV